jgi:hypothetical protein
MAFLLIVLLVKLKPVILELGLMVFKVPDLCLKIIFRIRHYIMASIQPKGRICRGENRGKYHYG